jgi:DnaJ-class molecular chaperone
MNRKFLIIRILNVRGFIDILPKIEEEVVDLLNEKINLINNGDTFFIRDEFFKIDSSIKIINFEAAKQNDLAMDKINLISVYCNYTFEEAAEDSAFYKKMQVENALKIVLESFIKKYSLQINESNSESCEKCGGSGYFLGEEQCEECNDGYALSECPTCGGSGREYESCGNCEGEGRLEGPCPECSGTGISEEGNDCIFCEGSGRSKDECPECGGSGEFETDCPECGGTGEIEESCCSCGGTGIYETEDDCEACGGFGTILTTKDFKIIRGDNNNNKIFKIYT